MPNTRTKRRSYAKLQPPDDRPSPDVRPLKVTPAQGNHANTRYSGRTSDQDRTSDDSQAPDDRPPPDDRASDHRTESADILRTPDVRDPASLRTTGDSRTSDAYVLIRVGLQPMYPFAPLFCTKTIKYSTYSFYLGLAL